jgi:hypothetical protein
MSPTFRDTAIMGRPRGTPQALLDAENHPIAWFNALLRGVEREDRVLIDKATLKLELLGYAVYPLRSGPRQEAASCA